MKSGEIRVVGVAVVGTAAVAVAADSRSKIWYETWKYKPRAGRSKRPVLLLLAVEGDNGFATRHISRVSNLLELLLLLLHLLNTLFVVLLHDLLCAGALHLVFFLFTVSATHDYVLVWMVGACLGDPALGRPAV